jgi:hypothetical protein
LLATLLHDISSALPYYCSLPLAPVLQTICPFPGPCTSLYYLLLVHYMPHRQPIGTDL